LRKVVDFNLAEAMLNAAVNHELPSQIQTKGYAFFSKVAVDNPSADVFQRTFRIAEVASPPFPVAEAGKTCALVHSFGDTCDEAALRLREAKKRLVHIIGGGKP
jgi:hypothetical protein